MRQKPKAYLETSVISYATGGFSRQLVVAAQQPYTAEWLESVPRRYDRFVSELVGGEAMKDDPAAAVRGHQRPVEFAVLTIDPAA